MQPQDLAWAAGHIITFDDNTVLTYDADTEAPRWLSELGATITALAASDRLLVVATADNTVRGLDPKSGAEQWTHNIQGAGTAVAVAGSHWAVAFADTVARGEGAQIVKEYLARGVEVLAFGPEDTLAVGTATGLGVLIDDGILQTHGTQISGFSGAVGSIPTQIENITGVVAAPENGWYVTSGAKLYQLDEDLDVVRGTQMSDTLFSVPFVSPSKRYVGVRVDDDYVAVYTTDGLQQAGWVAYKERTIGAAVFGPKDWLGVAVGTGHANKMHLGAGMICRTDEHPGRPRSSWMLSYKAVDELWGASAPETAGGVGPAENPITPATVDAPSEAESSPAQTVLGLVVAAVVGVAVYFLMQ